MKESSLTSHPDHVDMIDLTGDRNSLEDHPPSMESFKVVIQKFLTIQELCDSTVIPQLTYFDGMNLVLGILIPGGIGLYSTKYDVSVDLFTTHRYTEILGLKPETISISKDPFGGIKILLDFNSSDPDLFWKELALDQITKMSGFKLSDPDIQIQVVHCPERVTVGIIRYSKKHICLDKIVFNADTKLLLNQDSVKVSNNPIFNFKVIDNAILLNGSI